MKIIYNGSYGPNIMAGGIAFTAGDPTEVADEAVAEALLAKSHFSAEASIPPPAKSKNGTAPVTEGRV